MTNETNVEVAADNAFDVETKILVEVNFVTLVYEIEEHIRHGWRVHQESFPVFTYSHYEVTLFKNRQTINRVKDSILGVIEARGEAHAEKNAENLGKARKARVEKTQERKSGPAVQGMMASLEAAKEDKDAD